MEKDSRAKNQSDVVKLPPTIPIANREKSDKFNGLGLFTKSAKSFGFGN